MGRPRLLMLDEPSLGLAPLIVREIFRIVRELNEKEGLTVLVVEQDARIALNAASTRVRARGRQGGGRRVERGAARRRSRPAELPRLLMAQFFQQVVSGLASGGIYGLLALALVLIHRATGVVNFAQGEMAMFSTYIAWTLTTNHGVSYWPAFAITLLVVVRRRLRDPPGRDPPGRARVADPRRDRHDRPAARCSTGSRRGSGRARCAPCRARSPAARSTIGGVAIAYADVGTIAVCFAAVLVIWAFFQFTKVGLALRAAARQPDEAASSASASR